MSNVSVQQVQSRLAAAFHRRQATEVVRAQKLADEIGRLARTLAEKAATAAIETQGFNLKLLNDKLDATVLRLVDEMLDQVQGFGRRAWESAVEALLGALPKEWLAALADSGRQQEATIVARYELEGVPRSELETAVKRLLFPPPSRQQVFRWLTAAPPGGRSWDERLRYWGEQTRAAMLTQLTQGLAAGENYQELERRLRPLADGLAYKSMRIARTEACRVAERANLAVADQLGDMVQGQQIIAVMDEWTRPHHAARHGRIYWKGADGVYRDDEGNPLPDLPDEPNCRCMTIPVLRPPDVLQKSPDVRAAFQAETKRLIPDPGSYMDWWELASTKERMMAVGTRRYQVMAKLLKRDPEWIDFLAPDGSLLSISQLSNEDAEQRQARRLQVEAMLVKQRMAYRQVVPAGWTQPLRSLPFALRGVASGEPGAVERLKAYIYAEAEAVFRPDRLEERRRLKWMATVHKAKEVREELTRRVMDWRKRAAKLVDIERTISESELPEPRKRELLAAMHDLQTRQFEQAIEEALFLPEKMRATLQVVADESLTEGMRSNLARAVRFIEGITSRTVANDVMLSAVTVRADPTDHRGKYDPRTNVVSVHHEHDWGRYVHELVHYIEMVLSSEKKKHIRKMFDSWTEGAQPEPLGAGYNEDEYYVKRTDDRRWPMDGKYAGKVDRQTREPKEVLTQSAESLALTPVSFASDYPELFDLLIDVLRDTVP